MISTEVRRGRSSATSPERIRNGGESKRDLACDLTTDHTPTSRAGWYEEPNVVPTWNYLEVQRGRVRLIDEPDRLRADLRLTRRQP
ncbi:MAG: FMN-binding negative transcriptional regulator [Planctomycetaceae bacterium]